MLAWASITAAAALSVTAPDVSLGTVPVAYFGGNTMHRGEENIAMLAKMRMVTIEKWEGPCWAECTAHPKGDGCKASCNVEQYIMDTLRRVKAANPKVACGVYLNTLMAFGFYNMTGRLAEAGALAEDARGGLVLVENDQGMKNVPVFGFDTEAGRKMYIDTVQGFKDTGVVDGFFGDKWDLGAKKDKTSSEGYWKICNKACGYVTAEQGQAWNDGKKAALSAVTELMGDGPYYANGHDFEGVESNFNGYKSDWQGADPEDIIKWVAEDRKTHKYLWFSTGDQHWNKDPNSAKTMASGCQGDCLARFLLWVEEGCILGANGWAPEFDYALGNPTGAAVRDGNTLTRTFESGTRAVFTYEKGVKGHGTGKVYWANGAVSE